MVVRRARNLILVTSKSTYPAECLRLPTGGLNARETLLAGLARECQEELNLDVGDISCSALGLVSYANGFASYIFLLEVRESWLPDLDASGELFDAQFVSIDELPRVAASLEDLPETPKNGETWREWGKRRAVVHRIAHRALTDIHRDGRPYLEES